MTPADMISNHLPFVLFSVSALVAVLGWGFWRVWFGNHYDDVEDWDEDPLDVLRIVVVVFCLVVSTLMFATGVLVWVAR